MASGGQTGARWRSTTMRVRPLTLAQANNFVKQHHRHHKPCVGHRFSLGAYEGSELCGVAAVGRPVAREIDQYLVAEVTRLATNGSPNSCSFLYGACARVAKEMGFTKIQTYILESEPGTSLRAAGWVHAANTAGGDWNRGRRGNRRTDQPMCPKQRWGRILNAQ